MFESLTNAFSDRKEQVLDKYRLRIREKAISNAKASIALVGKRVEDYDAEQLEIIVQKEEEKIVERFRNTALYGVLAALGIGYF